MRFRSDIYRRRSLVAERGKSLRAVYVGLEAFEEHALMTPSHLPACLPRMQLTWQRQASVPIASSLCHNRNASRESWYVIFREQVAAASASALVVQRLRKRSFFWNLPFVEYLLKSKKIEYRKVHHSTTRSMGQIIDRISQ